MKKKKQITKTGNGDVSIFTFGDPVPVLKDSLANYDLNNSLSLPGIDYFVPPVSLHGLARLLKANPYHGPIIEFKTNLVCQGYQPTPALSRKDLHAAVTDYNVFNNAYMKKIKNGYGEVVRLEHIPALNIRRMKEQDKYCQIRDYYKYIAFQKGEVVHIKNYDVSQNIYGVPYYLGAIQSMLLNEDATLFRRKYYRNGAHMGYILSTTGNLPKKKQQKIFQALQASQGAGNFKNMYIHIPENTAKGDSVKIHPVGDFSTRDELEKIKNLTRDDIIAAHRMPPAMASIMPQNTAGYGDLDKIDRVYKINERNPVRDLFLDLNKLLPIKLHLSFDNGDDKH